MAFKLVHRAKEVPITFGGVLIGRSAVCKVVVDDLRVSRRHACVRLMGSDVIVDDLGSSNGVLVNGERVDGSRRLAPGDVLQVGSERLQVQATPEPGVHLEPSSAAPIQAEDDPPTHEAVDALLTTSRVVDEAIAAGDADRAEHLAEPLLSRLLMKAKKLGPLSSSQEGGAAKLALALARATRRSTWVDYVFELYEKSPRTLSLELVQELLQTMGEVRLSTTETFRAYLQLLRDRRAELDREGREVLRKLERFVRAEETRTVC